MQVKDSKTLTNKGTMNANKDSKFTSAEGGTNGTLKNQGTSDTEKATLNVSGATFDIKVENEANSEINAKENSTNTFNKELTNKGTLNAEKGSKIQGEGEIKNEANATINAKGAIFENTITTNSGSTINVSGENTFSKDLTNKGTLKAEAGSTITTSGNDGKIDNQGKLNAKGANFVGKVENTTSGTITATATGDNNTNTFNDEVTNANGATIKVESGNVKIEKSLENKGTLTIEKDSSFSGNGKITNTGTDSNNKGATFDIEVENAENGTITASGNNDFKKGLTNAGELSADASSDNVTIGGVITNTGGTITAKGGTDENAKLTFKDKTTMQGGEITITGNVDFGSGLDLGSDGMLKAGDSNTATTIGGAITSSGKIEAKGGSDDDKKLTFNGKVTNNATDSGKGITATGKVDFKGSLDNAGIFNAGDGKTETTIGGNITNKDGGTITANGNGNKKVTFSETLSNESGGTIEATGQVDFTKGLTNSGDFTAGDGTTATTIDGVITNQNGGTINANGATFSGTITTESGSTINASGEKNTFSKALENVSGATFNVKSGETTFSENLTNKGTLNAELGSTLKAENGKKIINQGTDTDNKATINAKGATFSGEVENKEHSTITASGNNTFSKKVTNEKGATFEVKSGDVKIEDSTDGFTNKGTLNAESGSFSGSGKITNQGTSDTEKATINANGATFGIEVENKANGTITTNGANTFSKAVTNESNATFTNNGRVTFGESFTNKGGTFSNNGEVIFEKTANFKDNSDKEADYQNTHTMTFKSEVAVKTFTNMNNGTLNASGATFNGALTNYGNAFVFGDNESKFTKAVQNVGYFEAKSKITASEAFNNTGNLNLIGTGAVLTLTKELTNDGRVIFSFLNGGLGQIDASDSGAKFNNIENSGKLEVNLKGMGKHLGTFEIIKDKADATESDSQITLKDSDVIFVGGNGTYLGNGKVLISEVFPNIPTGRINTPIIATQMANASSMNNMFQTSNAIISGNMYNTKYGVRMANRSSNSGFKIALNGLKANESFFYDSKRMVVSDARGSAKSNARELRMYKNQMRDNAESQTHFQPHTAQSSTKDDFYFLLTPFVNHTAFNKSGDYKVSGLDYGFVTAFGGKVANDNTLGVHFVFDYAKLSDKNSAFDATNKNFMVGIDYRLDLIYEMYFKARGDFYYFMNQTQGANPNNLGGGVSVAYGKDFVDWKGAGVLGIELGLDYKALNTGEVTTDTIFGGSNPNDEYKSAIHHLLYVDLGLKYYKYFGTSVGLWGLDIGIGGRANLTPKIASGNTLLVGNRSVDITLDNDNFLGYVSVGGSYVLEAQNYDMEFTLRYNGSFGDKSISNGGSFEWRTRW